MATALVDERRGKLRRLSGGAQYDAVGGIQRFGDNRDKAETTGGLNSNILSSRLFIRSILRRAISHFALNGLSDIALTSVRKSPSECLAGSENRRSIRGVIPRVFRVSETIGSSSQLNTAAGENRSVCRINSDLNVRIRKGRIRKSSRHVLGLRIIGISAVYRNGAIGKGNSIFRRKAVNASGFERCIPIICGIAVKSIGSNFAARQIVTIVIGNSGNVGLECGIRLALYTDNSDVYRLITSENLSLAVFNGQFAAVSYNFVSSIGVYRSNF